MTIDVILVESDDESWFLNDGPYGSIISSVEALKRYLSRLSSNFIEMGYT